jgi:hypothetical protein
MGWACSTHREVRNFGVVTSKEAVTHRWEDNIKLYLRHNEVRIELNWLKIITMGNFVFFLMNT